MYLPGHALSDRIAEAARAIRSGEVVAFPTETFYGLAVDPTNASALERLFACKGRSIEQASALLVTDLAMFAELCLEVPDQARRLAAEHWPGPLTLALPARPELPPALVIDGCVAARVSSHPVAAALVVAVGKPITATSANLAGAPPARSAAEVDASLGDDVLVLDGGLTPGGEPSTLVRVRAGQIDVLRQGAVRLAP
jgi:L-threonylcarbamoyladenylate synthase